MPAFRIRGVNNRRMRPGRFAALAAAAVAVAALGEGSAPARAEIYRCVGADGGVTFTDDRSACTGAARHDLKPRVQQVVERTGNAATPPAAAVRRGAPPAIDEEGALQEQWMRKKLRAEAELEALRHRAERLERTVTGCNRGMDVFARDPETGIKARLSCDQIRQEYTDTRAKSRQLREYLETGLQLECRRAGCLPGWIR